MNRKESSLLANTTNLLIATAAQPTGHKYPTIVVTHRMTFQIASFHILIVFLLMVAIFICLPFVVIAKISMTFSLTLLLVLALIRVKNSADGFGDDCVRARQCVSLLFLSDVLGCAEFED